jgi:signal transduction histidine kinase
VPETVQSTAVTQAGDSGEVRPAGPTPFKRLLVWPALVCAAAELIGVALPIWTLFGFEVVPTSTLMRIVAPVGGAAAGIWVLALAVWLAPIRRVIALKRTGTKVPKELSVRAYASSIKLPLRALALRTALWVVSAAAIAAFLWRYAGWPENRIVELAAVAGLHAFLVAGVRAAWLAKIMSRLRGALFSVTPPIRRFADGYFRRLVLVTSVVWGGILLAQAAFLYYFVPITHTQYLQIQTFAPIGGLAGLAAWCVLAWRLTRDLRAYMKVAQAEGGGAAGAADTYRRAQVLPYRFALGAIGAWIVYAAAGIVVAKYVLRFATDDTAIMTTTTLVVAVAGTIYAALWHRETLRPLLAHLSQRYRVPVRGMTPALSLRSKLLLAFGGVVLLACGMALVWGFLQYKNQATQAVARQADIGLAWLRSELQGELAADTSPPTPDKVRVALRTIAARSPEASAVMYYVADDVIEPLAVGGGPMGAPRLPWYRRAQVSQAGREMMSLGPAELTGLATRLRLGWHGQLYDLGAIAVFYPSYLGRGQSMVRPLKELLLFFVVLFGACAGIVIVTVGQFVSPIRRLERRADGMARGELADPVQSSGEGDEIGRLTYALEEMRRALRDKLRSTEEVNLDLERAVQMRTADLAKKNRELAETLDKLTRAQQQLVRSEKLASIGQLVAGIAHEINNPVNAIVNTVGPLEAAIGDVDSADAGARSEAAKDIRDMVRVVQRGAQRTKAIVQALHNYSRTDDENVVEFDLDRSIDDSLELLRHLLKQNVTVEKKFGDVGRVRGHAGQINQVFMNLLTNAAQALAGREHATITIETRVDGDDVVAKITDNGPGIPPEVLPRIWDPFFTTKEVGEGTGLGLSIVHELVERHHGTIECDTTVGQGTTFTIRLPRKAPEVVRLPRADSKVTARPA